MLLQTCLLQPMLETKCFNPKIDLLQLHLPLQDTLPEESWNSTGFSSAVPAFCRILELAPNLLRGNSGLERGYITCGTITLKREDEGLYYFHTKIKKQVKLLCLNFV